MTRRFWLVSRNTRPGELPWRVTEYQDFAPCRHVGAPSWVAARTVALDQLRATVLETLP